MLRIDGSSGEGGGQVLRTSLTLSCITGIPFKIFNIRGKRSEAGLRPQHLKSVEAAAEISGASVEGAMLGSQEIIFYPGRIKNRQYKFDIGTAGSTSLLFQTIFLPLSFSEGISRVQINGGTHVPWSPCFDYLNLHWLHYMNLIGFESSLDLETAGFYPRGGGQIIGKIKRTTAIQPLLLPERGNLVRIRGVSGVSNLDGSIATRQKHQALKRLEPLLRDIKIQTLSLPGPSKGTYLLLLAEYEYSHAGFFSLGKKGKPAEAVADEALDELLEFMGTDGSVDKYLADQLLLPLSFAEGESIIRASQITQHLRTNRDIIQKFLPISISIQEEGTQSGLIKVSASGKTIDYL
jgi:RNA 3'-terminal phosphate cyclase (ATP)